MKDLLVLVADKNMEFLLKGVLPRIPKVEGLKEFSFDIFVHPYRDPGIYSDADEFLRGFSGEYSKTLVMLDHEGCGHGGKSREEIEKELENKLNKVGWKNRNCVVCIAPELENWIWVNEVRMREAISWNQNTGLYDWLHNRGLKAKECSKPDRPKEAFEKVLKVSSMPRSSAIYYEIGSKASYKQCKDNAFKKMLGYLKASFPLPAQK